MQLFHPVKRFFGKLSFQKKIVVMIFAVIIPFLLPSYFTFKTFYEELQTIEEEKNALAYVLPIKELIKALQRHRGLVQSVVNGERQFMPFIQKEEQKIERLFQTVQLPSSFFVTWKNLRFGNETISGDTFRLHTYLIENLLRLIQDRAHRLRVDRNVDTHYLMMMLFDILPTLQEYVAQLRGRVSGYLSRGQINKPDIIEIHALEALILSQLRTLEYAVDRYLSLYPNEQNIASTFVLIRNEIERFLTFAHDLLYRDPHRLDVRKFFDQATALIDDIDRFYDRLLENFRSILENRKKELLRNQFLLLLGLTSVVMLVSYLFIGFFRSIQDPLQRFEEAIESLDATGVPKPLEVETEDELRHIADVFNAMTKRIRRQIHYLWWYQKALESATYVCRCDVSGKVSYCSQAFLQRLGYKKEEIIGKRFDIVWHPKMDRKLFDEIVKQVLSRQVWQGIVRMLAHNGQEVVMQTSVVPVMNEMREIEECIVVCVDITELVRAKRQIERMLYYDTLTQLPNRTKLIEDIRKREVFAVVVFNIDDFRQLNDLYGYEAGNFVLQTCAKRMRSFETSEVGFYRLPADEFAAIFFAPINKDEVLRFASEVIEDLENNRINYGEYEISMLLKAGVAMVDDQKEGEKYLLDADSAVKEAKDSNEKILFYDESKSAKETYKKTLMWVAKIRSALHDGRIVPYFQPICNNKTGEIEKYEALVRLVDEDGVVHSPAAFLDIAKRAKLYTQITQVMIERSFEIFANRPEELSINVSVQDILNPQIKAFIYDRLRTYKKGANRVVFEITESEEMENYEVVADFIQRVKDIGAKVAIDDFGSGYSNFVYILNMGVDYLKIDASLIKNILHDEKSRTLVRAIVHFSHELGLKTIGEFVSDEMLLHEVRKLGVDYSQGYYLGKPLCAKELPSI